MCAAKNQAPHHANDRRPTSIVTHHHVSRPALTGPVVADLHPRPGVAQLDARHAARVLAGWTVAGWEGADEAVTRAVRVGALRSLLEACGLVEAPRWKPRQR
jgi:hypothetical protein